RLPAMSFPDRNRPAWFAGGAALLIAILMTIGLRMPGRVWIDDSGVRAFVASPDSPETSQHLADPYTFTHLLHGVVLFWPLTWAARRRLPERWRAFPGGAVSAAFVFCAVLEAGWELLENSTAVINRYRANTAALGYSGDAIVNSLGDLVACLAGFLLARQIGGKASAALFLAVELALLVAIRDGLLLSVVMLAVPLEGLQAWQAAR
ncbi:MAG: DUF2585 family protein, partial [Planctomycetota bacterium]